jgi:hypothetical protein
MFIVSEVQHNQGGIVIKKSGLYLCPVLGMIFSFLSSSLLAGEEPSIAGHREGAIELPGLENEFTLKQAKIVSIRFKTDEKDSVSVIELIQPDDIYEAKRVEE